MAIVGYACAINLTGTEAHQLVVEIDEDEDEDDMGEIELDNIVADGRRTRGKAIDFAKANAELDEEDDDEEEEDDEDFVDPDEDEEMKD